jgi:exosortase
VAVLLFGALLRFAGAYIYFESLEALSLIVCLAGLVIFLGGGNALRWAWPALAFLIFMIPLPFRIERALALPLQRLATKASTYALQTLGLPALAEGNVIHLHEARLGIAEACNGLGMLVSFVALATAVAIVINRPVLDKVLVILSSIPIALAVNILRITCTGILYETVGAEWADLFFHDLAGYLMPLAALAFLGIELKILSCLLVAPPDAREARLAVVPFTPRNSAAAPDAPKPVSSFAQGKV